MTVFELSCLAIFVFSAVIQIVLWAIFFPKFTRPDPEKNNWKSDESEEISISVIICAHNEAGNLKKNLPRILNQNYRSFEVIVVNDSSTDSTSNILLNYNIKYSNLRSVDINKTRKQIGKKHALAMGIAQAKNEVLLMTDADCWPESREWISEMQQAIRGQVEIGLGFGPYESQPGFLNKFIRFEAIYTAVQYFSFAAWQYPYMGVGRNLIYRKSLFDQAGGFSRHTHIASGDDDLFIRDVAKRKNTRNILQKSSFIYSTPKKNWRDYYRQKTRHVTTSTHYKPGHKLLLGLISFTHLMFYLGGILVALKISIIFVIIIYVVRMSIMMATYKQVLKQLDDTPLYRWVPILDFAFIMYYLTLSPAIILGNTNQWK